MSFLPSGLARVQREVEILSAEERAAIMLVCIKGLSYQDAAQSLGASPAIIQDHLLHGRRTLLRKFNLVGGKDRDRDQKALSPSSS